MSAERLKQAAALMREPRFWSKVELDDSGCWIWTAGTRSTGYGHYWTGERDVSSHRHAYEHLVGSIPEGLVIDHLCRNRLCCNPAHMEPVTNRENVRRGAAAVVLNTGRCKHGHEMTPENTYVRKDGWTNCRACGRARTAAWKARRAA